MLALHLARNRDELEADFRQYYGLDLGGMGTDYTVSHAAVLASQLPPNARCMAKLSPNLAWTQERAALERLDYHVRYLMWMLSKDGAKGVNRPKPPETPSQVQERTDQIIETQHNRALVERLLGGRPD